MIEFQDYTGEEMFKIFSSLCKKNHIVLTPGAGSILQGYFDNMFAHRDKNFGNGRTVRNVFQEIYENQNKRLDSLMMANPGITLGVEDMTTFNEADVLSAITKSTPKK